MTVDVVGARLRSAVQETAKLLTSSEPSLPEREIEDTMCKVMAAQDHASERPWTQVPISLDGWEGRLGPLDLALKDERGAIVAAVEIKSCGRDNLSPCAWDVVKLAQALAEGAAARAFLVAAAPRQAWQEKVPGAELFDNRNFLLNTHLRRYEGWFDFWRRDVQNFPRRLPSRWETDPLWEEVFERGGNPWDLRLAEILQTGAQMVVIYAPKGTGEEGDIPDPEAENRLAGP